MIAHFHQVDAEFIIGENALGIALSFSFQDVDEIRSRNHVSHFSSQGFVFHQPLNSIQRIAVFVQEENSGETGNLILR